MLFSSLQFSVNVVLPTILMMVFGIFLRRYRWIDDHFCTMAAKLVFNFAIPTMLFFNVARNNAEYSSHLSLIMSGVIGTFLIYFVAEWWAGRYIQTKALRAIFTQGTFRSNAAVLGLALSINAYGNDATAIASVFVAAMVILFNLLGVVTLTKSLSDKPLNFFNLLISTLKNPLILGVLLGLIANKSGIFPYIPTAVIRTGDYLGGITLPLALICTGASLNFKQLTQFRSSVASENEASRIVLIAATVRLIVAPVLMVFIGKFLFHLDSVSLGILFLIIASPVASAVYAMIKNYGGDGSVAANLIGVITIGSIFTSSLGLFLLRQIGWV